jgi:hypothetical protein
VYPLDGGVQIWGGGSGSKHFRLILNHHPVRSIKGSFAIFLLMSRPPLLARRGDAVAEFKLRHY